MLADNLRGVSQRLINTYGSDIILLEVVQGAFDTTTGLYNQTIEQHETRGHIGGYTSSELVDGVVDIKDIKVLVYADSFDITKVWGVEYDGMKYNILNISKTTAQNESIIYILQCRAKHG